MYLTMSNNKRKKRERKTDVIGLLSKVNPQNEIVFSRTNSSFVSLTMAKEPIIGFGRALCEGNGCALFKEWFNF